jgi:UDP-N-acetylmuramate--alanine ligase
MIPASARIHFMGIGGVGVSALARWYQADGYRVSGCDNRESQELLALQRQGIEVHLGHSPEHLEHADVLVSSMAVPYHHPELLLAREQGLCTLLRIELLAELLGRRRGVTVTGTHGKSTTTAMIATIFLKLGCDPSILLGGQLPLLGGPINIRSNIGSNVHYGKGAYLIAEVDESDPGFAKLPSELAVLTNLEDDHIAGSYAERRNYHASLAELELAALNFAGSAQRVLYCADWANLPTLLGNLPVACSYGFESFADYRAEGLEQTPHGSTFRFTTPQGERHTVSLAIPGEHNVQNATAALAAAHLQGLPASEAARALAEFTGVGRRWQRRGSSGGALVIDDYAHHPTEIRVTLEAARHTGRRVRAVLQPHRWVRTAQHWRAIADAAALADEVLVLDVYAAGEEAIPGVSAALIVERLGGMGVQASYHSLESAQDYLVGTLAANDLVITLGAGDVWKVAVGLVAARGGDDGTA